MAWEKLRIGVVGAGANTLKYHIPGLQAIDGVEVVSVANRSRASGERVAQQFHIPTVYDNWQALVAASDTDAIVIGTWPYLHCPVTLAALAANKHVLTEARMAMNAAQARAMLAAARAHPDRTCMVVPSPFSFAVDAAIQAKVAEGYLGEIIGVELHGNASSFAEQFGAPLHWRHNRDLSGVNILTMGIWYEAVMRWVGEATRVMARTKIVVRNRRDETGETRFVTVPDHAEVIADLACGAVGHFSFSAATGLARPPEAWLFGTEGTLTWQMGSQMLAGGQRGSSELAPIAVRPEQRGGWRVEEEFVNAVRGLEPVRHTTFEDGVRYMEFSEAVSRSAASGQAVALPLLD